VVCTTVLDDRNETNRISGDMHGTIYYNAKINKVFVESIY
jgi:carbohydrate-binding DOMON domain-containing protein